MLILKLNIQSAALTRPSSKAALVRFVSEFHQDSLADRQVADSTEYGFRIRKVFFSLNVLHTFS